MHPLNTVLRDVDVMFTFTNEYIKTNTLTLMYTHIIICTRALNTK